MKTLFIHYSERLTFDDNNNAYTDGSYSEKVLKRYQYFGDVTFAFRKNKKIINKSEIVNKANRFDLFKYHFLEIPSSRNKLIELLSFIIRINQKNVLKQAITESDFIILRSPTRLGNWIETFCKKNNKPFLVEVVGCPFDSLIHYSIFTILLAPKAYWDQKCLVKKAQAVLYVSNQFLQYRYPSNGITCSCSDVDIPFRDEHILDSRIQKIKHHNTDGAIILCTIGGVNIKYKGQYLVLKVIRNLKRKNIVINYWLIGGGNQKKLKQLAHKYDIENNLKFIGAVPHENVFSYLQLIDIYVQPSLSEGMPRALIEAMSCSCPCLGSDVGGIPELLTKQCIFKSGKIKDLEKKLLWLNNTANLITESVNNYKRSKEFRTDVLDAKREHFYEKILLKAGK